MARVTLEEVQEILDSGFTASDSQINAMILAADLVITKVFVDDTVIGADLLKEIERWFVAHMLSYIFDKFVIEEAIGDAKIKYYSKMLGKGLSATTYGQMVLLLDTSGKMANMGKAAASIFAIPTIQTY